MSEAVALSRTKRTLLLQMSRESLRRFEFCGMGTLPKCNAPALVILFILFGCKETAVGNIAC